MGGRKQPLHPPSLTQRSSSSPSIRLLRLHPPPLPAHTWKITCLFRRSEGHGDGEAPPEVCRSFGWISSSPVPIDAPVSASVNPPHTKSRKWLQVHFLKGPVPLKRGRGAACCHRSPAWTHGDIPALVLLVLFSLLLLFGGKIKVCLLSKLGLDAT